MELNKMDKAVAGIIARGQAREILIKLDANGLSDEQRIALWCEWSKLMKVIKGGKSES